MYVIVYLFFFSLSTCLLLGIHYFVNLLSQSREIYQKSELVDWKMIIKKELAQICFDRPAYFYLGSGILVGILFSLTSTFLKNFYVNFLIYSALIPALCFWGISGIFKSFSFSDQVKKYEIPIFMGVALAIIAGIFTASVMGNTINFFWAIFNVLIIVFFIFLKLRNILLKNNSEFQENNQEDTNKKK